MPLNIEKYLPYLDHYDWPHEDKIEMLYVLWRMMESEADKAFGLHPVQLICGQNENISSQNPISTVDSKCGSTVQVSCDAANDDTPQTKGNRDAG